MVTKHPDSENHDVVEVKESLTEANKEKKEVIRCSSDWVSVRWWLTS